MSETEPAVTSRPSAQTLRLRVSEVFLSLQGEAAATGWPTVFVRLTGCPLRCVWCDTEYAFHGGQSRDVESVVAEVADYGVRHVCVTGGEPLAQKNCQPLLAQLCDAGYSVSLETSGAIDVGAVDARVNKVIDLKAPASGESQRNRWDNLDKLTAGDQLKMVLADRNDYEWACGQLREHDLAARATVFFSPVAEQLPPGQLADWIVADRLPVRLQVQLHKYLWGDIPGK